MQGQPKVAHGLTHNRAGIPPGFSAADLTWTEYPKRVCPAQALLSGLSHPCFGVGSQEPAIICLEERLVPVRIQQVLSFALEEYPNNLTVDVLIPHLPAELFLWL